MWAVGQFIAQRFTHRHRHHFGAGRNVRIGSDFDLDGFHHRACYSTARLRIETDLVLSAIGVRPDLRLAQLAGISTNKGIVTNRYLETSQTDIYAIGDGAEVDGTVLVYVLPLLAQVKALAKTLNGNATAVSYGVMPVSVKTSLHPVIVNLPASSQSGEWHIDVVRITKHH